MIQSNSLRLAVALLGVSIASFDAPIQIRADERSPVSSDSIQSGDFLLSGSIQKRTSNGQPVQWSVSIKNLSSQLQLIGSAGTPPFRLRLVDRLTGNELTLSTAGNYFFGDNIQFTSYGFIRLKPGDETQFVMNLREYFDNMPPGSYELKACRHDGDISKSRSALTMLFEVTN